MPMGEAGGGELVGRRSAWVAQGVAFLLGDSITRKCALQQSFAWAKRMTFKELDAVCV
jgi:hypothetical protein